MIGFCHCMSPVGAHRCRRERSQFASAIGGDADMRCDSCLTWMTHIANRIAVMYKVLLI
jgi:hypothetical protein